MAATNDAGASPIVLVEGELPQVPVAPQAISNLSRPAVHTRLLVAAAALLIVVAGAAAVLISRNGSEPSEQGPVATTDASSTTDAISATTEVPVVSSIDYGNLTYASSWMDDDVTLVDGAWVEVGAAGQATTTRISLHDVEVLDGESLLALVYLRTDPGGSGTFYDVYAITNGEAGLVVSKPAALGDRISAISLTLTVLDDGSLSPKVGFTDQDGASQTATYVLEGTELVRKDDVNEASPLSDRDVLDNLVYPTEWVDGDVSLSGGQWVEADAEGGAATTRFSLESASYFENPGPLAIVTLAVDPGGSGTFYDLYVVTAEGEEIEVSQPVSLGDRVADIEIALVNGPEAAGGSLPDSVQVSFVDRDGREQLRQFALILGELILVN